MGNILVGVFLHQKTAVFVALLSVVFLTATQAVNAATTIYVPDDYSTIQAAVNAANPGDTIIVRDGTYTENVDVNKDHLTIRSENGAAQTTIEIGDKTGFVLQNDGVKVTGFRIQGGPTRAPIGVHIDRAAGCEVSNSTIENTNYGVRVDGSTSATISNNEIVSLYCGVFAYDSSMLTIQGNTIDLCVDSGVYLWLVEDSLVSENEISPEHTGPSRGGMCLSASSSNSIIDNTFVNDGIVVRDAGTVSSCNNTMTGNTVNGKEIVYLEGSSSLSVSEAGQVILVACDNIAVIGLDLSGTIVPIQLVRTDNCQISSNQVTPSDITLYYNGFFADLGISLQDSANNTILNNWGGGVCLIASDSNILQGNNAWPQTEMIMLYRGSTGNQIVENSIYYLGLGFLKNNNIYLNNIRQGVYGSSLDNIWRSPEEIAYDYHGTPCSSYLGNYWSEYSGGDADGDGIGDVPYVIGSDSDDYPLIEPFENYLEPANQSPLANAGPDQTITDVDGNGSESVALDGGGSYDPDGDIVSWVWTKGGSQIATGETPTLTLSVGVHTITLTVTDNDTATDTDEVVITVQGVSPTPVITATKTGVDVNGGTLILGDRIEYTIVIRNLGGGNQPNNPGNEFEDVLSTGLGNLGYVMGSAFASSGTVEYKSSSDPWYRKIIWNGSIPAGGSVTIRFTSPVNWGTEATNQGTVYYDSGGGGTNDASVLTDDPNLPGDHDPTVLAVSPNLSLILVDPIPELIDPNNPPTYIDADTRSVSFLGRRVTGVAADGVARLVLRVEIDPPTTGSVTLSIEDPDLATPSSQDGSLSSIDGTESGTTITVPVHKVGGSAYALAVYYSPEDFVRPEMVLADEASRERSIYIKADYQGTQTSFPIRITRPPVVLIHGLWGSRIGWDNFSPLHDDDRFWIRVFDYETTNDESFDINSRRVFAQTAQAVTDYKRVENVAAVQVDAVTHSMGGVLARAAYGLDAFWTYGPTFGEGYFHKVLSIGTPHFGSRWASVFQHFYSGWDYWRHVLSDAMDFDPFNNALEDLARGSLAIQHLTDTEGPLSHNIVGITPEPDSLPGSVFLAGISLHPDVTYNLFTAIFGGLENDLIVGVDSQRGGFAEGASTTSQFSPVIHSDNPWLQMISPNTMYETEDPDIAKKAIQLLNQPLHSNLFAPLPAISWSVSEVAFSREAPRSTSAVEGGIAILSPQNGALFEVGETVTVTVQSIDGVTLDMVFLGSPGFLLLDDESPFEFAFELPDDTVGPRNISVLGVDASGNTYLDEITINVATSAVLIEFGVNPGEIDHLQVGEGLALYVWGEFADGQTRDITKAPETSYSSDSSEVASVDLDGVITGVGRGSTVINVSYGGQTATTSVNVEASNDPPVAEAGADQTGSVGNPVQLDGSGSSDPDDDPLTFSWEIVSSPGGSTATILNPDAVNPTFTPDVAGQYIAKLTVDDANGGTDSDTVLIAALQSTPAVFRVDDAGNVLADQTFYGAAFQSGAADIAEWVHISTPVDPGDVVEFDPTAPGQYRMSQNVCSSLVAGVISTTPGVTLGGSLVASEKALLALIGIVPVKVTDEGGPIQPGDLLVTSSTSGHAMRWAGPDPCLCSLVGKALEPMSDEQGVILVLLTAH